MNINPFLLPDFGIPYSPNAVSISIINTTVAVASPLPIEFYVPPLVGNEYLVAPPFSTSAIPRAATRSQRTATSTPQVSKPSSGATGTTITWETPPPSATTPSSSYDPSATFLESDYAGREPREISFQPNSTGHLTIDAFQAHDYFADSSYYLLSMPGHAVGHMGALARVTADPESFIFMGGDSCHHVGEFRPSKYKPLPDNISPNPFTSISAPNAPCPGAQFEAILDDGDRREEVYDTATQGIHVNVTENIETVAKLQVADGRDNILVAIAHDQTLPGVVGFFPKTANHFMEAGWPQKLRWLFLRDFARAVRYNGTVEGRHAAFDYWNGPQ